MMQKTAVLFVLSTLFLFSFMTANCIAICGVI